MLKEFNSPNVTAVAEVYELYKDIWLLNKVSVVTIEFSTVETLDDRPLTNEVSALLLSRLAISEVL